MSEPGVASYGFATLVAAAFSLYLAFGRRGGAKAAILLAAVGFSALSAACGLGYALTASPGFWGAQVLTDALRIAGWLLFAIAVLAGTHKAKRWTAILVVVPALAWLLGHPAPAPSEAAAGADGSRAPFAFWLALSVGGLVLAEQLFRRAREEARWALKPLCLGLGGGFVFDLYVYADALLLGRLDADLWAARGLAQALVIPFIAVATARNKDWTLDIALSRGVVFHSTAFLASGLYLLAVAGAGYYVRYFGGTWGKAFQAGFIFAAVLLLGWMFSSGALRARLRIFINKNFFSYRYDYREEWLRFTSLLMRRDTSASALQRCIEALANLVESPAGALWLRGEDGAYSQSARWNLAPFEGREAPDSALPRFLSTTGWIIDVPEYHDHAARYPGLELPEWLTALPSAWLVVPLIAQEELTGFVVLASPRAPMDVNWEVRDLLKAAARQAGSFVAETRASEALLEARKFESFNKMSAFVVHDLKNLVAQLTLLLRNAERHRDNPRFQSDMLATVRHVSDRMEKLLLQLSTGSRPSEALRPLHAGRLVERVVQAKAGGGGKIALHSAADVVVLGHELRLERVIGHLLQNALDATRERGDVRVAVFAEDDRAVIEVSDTGCGMNDEFLRERLFRPFQTTKAAGMGIGAYETAQVVKEMGGTIEAESREGAGTRIRIILPLHADPSARASEARVAA